MGKKKNANGKSSRMADIERQLQQIAVTQENLRLEKEQIAIEKKNLKLEREEIEAFKEDIKILREEIQLQRSYIDSQRRQPEPPVKNVGQDTTAGDLNGFAGNNTAPGITGTSVEFSPLLGSYTMTRDGVTLTISVRYYCITSMREYEGKSLEELRLEDYTVGRKRPSPAAASTPVFGSANTTETPPTGLGSNNTSSSGSRGGEPVFGSANTTETPATGLGSNNTSSSRSRDGEPVFGSANTTETPATGLGSNNTSSSGSRGGEPVFGSANTTETPATGLGSNNTSSSSSRGGEQPIDIEAYRKVMKSSLIIGDIFGAKSALNKVLLHDPNNSRIRADQEHLEYLEKFLREADGAFAKKNFDQVIYCMDRCCDVSTSCPAFKLRKAECLTFLARFQEAKEIANNIFRTDKKNADAVYVSGMCFYYQGNLDRALIDFKEVFRLAPDHSKTLNIYKRAKALKQKREQGNAAFEAKKYSEAFEFYSEALSVDPLNSAINAKLHFNKALIYAQWEKFNESLHECNQALKLNQLYLKALLKRAACLMELEDFEEAISDYERACEMDSSKERERLLQEAKVALTKPKKKDYYETLGIDKNASPNDIKQAYRKKAIIHHPDKHVDASESRKKGQERKFKEVGKAYSVLSNSKERKIYDNCASREAYEEMY